MSGTYVLKLTSAIAVDGEVMKAGSLVEVSEIEAKNLLSRGKAELHGEQKGAPRDLNALNKDELRDLAEQLQITVTDKMTKAQLLEAIEHYDAENSAEKVPGVSGPMHADPAGTGTASATGDEAK